VILGALGPTPEAGEGTESAVDSILTEMKDWRAAVARNMGVPAFTVIPDGVLSAIAEVRPQNRLDLARIRGVGPRLLAKFADDLLRLCGNAGSRESGVESLETSTLHSRL
jgi:superfamily II DNA helicase RecQ